MVKKGIEVASEVVTELQTARLKIVSGCFSTCEVACTLSLVEGQLFSRCHLLAEQEVTSWCDLLAEAMQGKLDYERIRGVAALDPIRERLRIFEMRLLPSKLRRRSRGRAAGLHAETSSRTRLPGFSARALHPKRGRRQTPDSWGRDFRTPRFGAAADLFRPGRVVS